MPSFHAYDDGAHAHADDAADGADTWDRDDDADALDGEGSDAGDERDNLPYWAAPTPRLEWRSLRLGDVTLRISSEGHVHHAPFTFVDISEGIDVTGTPYRMWSGRDPYGDLRQYYIHDLVYHAFMGSVPPDWEVRHTPEAPMNERGKYLNHLEYIDVYPSRLSRDL